MINLLKNLLLTILMSFPMVFASYSIGMNVDKLDEAVFGPCPLRPSMPEYTSLDIATALECLPCTANKKEFSRAKSELLRWMDAIELKEPSAIAMRAMLKKGVEEAYAEDGSRDHGDTCMLALAARVDYSSLDLHKDIRESVVLAIAEKLRTLSFTAEKFAEAKVELLLKLTAIGFRHEPSHIILEILRASIDAV